MKKNLVVVLIISHKPELNENELISLKQCYKVLFQYPIKMVCPNNIDLSFYTNNLPDPKFDLLDPVWLSTYRMFNKLKIDSFLYEKYSAYKYILFYEPDAYVFKDDLEFWCNQGYDYIGAPWIDMSLLNWLKNGKYPKKLYWIHRLLGNGIFLNKVGNGGLSLRRVKACSFNSRLFHKAASKWEANEDSFWAHYVKTFNPFFRIASFKDALSFSFDVNPQKSYELNKNHLPFACHAWCKENPPYIENLKFWSKIIHNESS